MTSNTTIESRAFLQIRHQTVVHRYIVQCVLPINLFNEKIFIFIWFWLALLSILSITSALKWTWNLAFWPAQVKYIKNQLRIAQNKREHENITKFVNKYLKRDGIFIIRLLGNNVGHLVACEVSNGLWDNYGPEHKLLAADKPVAVTSVSSPATSRPHKTVVRLNSLAERLENV